jgi:hypothetical protein
VAVEQGKPLSASVISVGQRTPNPVFTGTLDFNAGDYGKGVLAVYNASGALVFSYPVSGQGSVSWNKDKLTSGLYVARLVAGGKIVSRKLIVMR